MEKNRKEVFEHLKQNLRFEFQDLPSRDRKKLFRMMTEYYVQKVLENDPVANREQVEGIVALLVNQLIQTRFMGEKSIDEWESILRDKSWLVEDEVKIVDHTKAKQKALEHRAKIMEISSVVFDKICSLISKI